VKLSLAQINPTVGDLPGNVEKCVQAAQQAAVSGADLIALPQMAIPGCHPQDILLDAGFIAAVADATRDLAERTAGLPPILVGTILTADPTASKIPPGHAGLLNAAVLLQGGVVTVVSTQQQLPAQDIHFAPRWFLPGKPPAPVEINGKKVLVLVGDPPASDPPADLILCLDASPYTQGIYPQRFAAARQPGKTIICLNLMGGNDALIYDGRSFALDAQGRYVAQLAAFEEDIKTIDFADLTTIAAPSWERQRMLYEALALGIRDFADKNGIPRAFIGLSGGIDSALTAALTVHALGPDRVMGIAMPSRHTDPRSTQAAQVLAANLGIDIEVVPIEPLHAAAESSLPHLLDSGTGAENVQARIRMLILMGYVNRYGGMLINTGNKTEAALGYATLYGDTAGTICPIADLTKPQVYELARWINTQQPVIPAFCLERPPSAELSPGQVDPFDYDEIAPKVEELVRANRSSPAMRAAEHKRAQSGIVLKVSEKAFGPGRMIPVTRK